MIWFWQHPSVYLCVVKESFPCVGTLSAVQLFFIIFVFMFVGVRVRTFFIIFGTVHLC